MWVVIRLFRSAQMELDHESVIYALRNLLNNGEDRKNSLKASSQEDLLSPLNIKSLEDHLMTDLKYDKENHIIIFTSNGTRYEIMTLQTLKAGILLQQNAQPDSTRPAPIHFTMVSKSIPPGNPAYQSILS